MASKNSEAYYICDNDDDDGSFETIHSDNSTLSNIVTFCDSLSNKAIESGSIKKEQNNLNNLNNNGRYYLINTQENLDNKYKTNSQLDNNERIDSEISKSNETEKEVDIIYEYIENLEIKNNNRDFLVNTQEIQNNNYKNDTNKIESQINMEIDENCKLLDEILTHDLKNYIIIEWEKNNEELWKTVYKIKFPEFDFSEEEWHWCFPNIEDHWFDRTKKIANYLYSEPMYYNVLVNHGETDFQELAVVVPYNFVAKILNLPLLNYDDIISYLRWSFITKTESTLYEILSLLNKERQKSHVFLNLTFFGYNCPFDNSKYGKLLTYDLNSIYKINPITILSRNKLLNNDIHVYTINFGLEIKLMYSSINEYSNRKESLFKQVADNYSAYIRCK